MLRLAIALRATTCPADDLVQDDGVLDGCDVPDWLRRALGLSAEWGGLALVRLVLFRVAPGRGGDLVAGDSLIRNLKGDRRDQRSDPRLRRVRP